MGRKKLSDLEKNGKQTKIPQLDIHGDAKRSIVAVLLFALSILLVLSFVGVSGTSGTYVNAGVGRIFGWGKWVSPMVLVAAGIVLIRRKEAIFYITKLIGILAIFWSILGFMHLYFQDTQMRSIAAKGFGGGYAGYAIDWLFVKYTGRIAGSVVLAAILIVGFIVTLNSSLTALVSLFMKKKLNSGENESGDLDVGQLPLRPMAGDNHTEGTNIKSIEYVEGPEEAKVEKASLKEVAAGIFHKNKITTKDNGSIGDEIKPEVAKDEYSDWLLPPTSLLLKSNKVPQAGNVQERVSIIQNTLRHFGIEVEPAGVQTGPTVTQYSFRPAVGVKLSRITTLNNDLALALAAQAIRIEAPIPGKSLIGIEVPNKENAIVHLRDLLEGDEFNRRKSNLTLFLGQDVSGDQIGEDLAKMPHLLIAGATNSGKSICVHSILISLLYQNTPDQLKLILVDPKRVEMSAYAGIPHLRCPVIVDNKKVINALKWAVTEMERRYRLLQDTGSRDYESYREKHAKGEQRRFVDPDTGEYVTEDLERLPYLVIVIDELADLMLSHGKEVEGAIIRLAQMARAVGIHLIISTQKPIVTVLTGLIKSNIATRIAFQVPSQIDSRTILDTGGAEKLLGRGDMLFMSPSNPKPHRIQGAFVSEAEVKKVVDFIVGQKKNKLKDEGLDELDEEEEHSFSLGSNLNNEDEDELYNDAKKIAIECKKASTSLLQRRLRVGYGRAARLIDMLEHRGIVGPADGSKPRAILIGQDSSPEYADEQTDQAIRDKWSM